jgi:hypothetical protein
VTLREAAAVRRGRGEDGAYIVLYALMTVAIFGMAALLLDLGAIRQDRRDARLSADLAATAGAADMELLDPNAAVAACQAAWAYVEANTRNLVASAPDCTTTFSTSCVSTTARAVAVSAPPYLIEIVNPVPDGHPFMQRELNRGDLDQATTVEDGAPCERIGVRVRRSRDAAFGPAVGFMGAVTDVHAVARSAETTTGGVFASVAALAPTGCNAVVVNGLDQLRIGSATAPGVLWLDSDASGCLAGQYIVNPLTGVVRVIASGGGQGTISSWATTLGLSGFALPPPPKTTPSVARAADRPALREPFDDRYNCNDSSCSPNPNAIDQLRASLGGPGPPPGYLELLDCSGAIPPLAGVDYYVTCAQITGSLTFTGNVVFENAVNVENNACLALNSTGCGGLVVLDEDSTFYVRNGSFNKKGNSSLYLHRTMVHTNGQFAFEPGTGSVVWTSPTGGDFEDLLIWAETSAASVIDEQRGTWQMVGAAFFPNASLEVRATTPPPKPVPVLEMQVYVRTLLATGNGRIDFAPRSDRGVTIPIRAVRLIR